MNLESIFKTAKQSMSDLLKTLINISHLTRHIRMFVIFSILILLSFVLVTLSISKANTQSSSLVSIQNEKTEIDVKDLVYLKEKLNETVTCTVIFMKNKLFLKNCVIYHE